MSRNHKWDEWQGPTPAALHIIDPRSIVYIFEDHVPDLNFLRDTLADELRTSGTVDTSMDARLAAKGATLVIGWHGFIEEDLIPEFCTSDGLTEHEETVDEPKPCVYAVVGSEYLA